MTGALAAAWRGSGVLMVLGHIDVLEHAERVVREDRGRAVERDEVRRGAALVDAHEAHRQARARLAREPRLEEADDAALLLARAHEQDVRLPLADAELVRRDERQAAPREERRAEERDRGRRDAAAGGLAAERGDRLGVREEERGLLPHLRDEGVEVVRGRRAGAGRDAHRRRGAREEAVVGVVDELALLALFHHLDEDVELLADLVHRAAVQIGDAGLHLQRRRDGAERVLARLLFVVDAHDRERVAVGRAALDADPCLAAFLHLVHAVRAGLDRGPRQQAHEPARRDAHPLRRRLGGVCELTSGRLAQCPAHLNIVSHQQPPRLEKYTIRTDEDEVSLLAENVFLFLPLRQFGLKI